MKENNNNKGRGVFYGVIGVATLVVAIIGATFAYFTAAATNGANVITGNMENIGFNLAVEKVVDPKPAVGMIPMANSMVEAAVSHEDGSNNPEPCVDEGGHQVCQIYKITLSTTSSGMDVDGFVVLTGGSGTPDDVASLNIATTAPNADTTMRWAQVFKDSTTGAYSTAGTQQINSTVTVDMSGDAIAETTATTATTGVKGFNVSKILTDSSAVIESQSGVDVVKTNYIRISSHALSGTAIDSTSFDRSDDVTSLLVINQRISNTAATELYFVVWLTENGHNQNPGGGTGAAATHDNFFNGIVKFISGQGNEVTASFNGYAQVNSDSNS